MSDEFGTLSEAEIIKEIHHHLENHPEIDSSDLEFKFEDEQLIVHGTLQTEEELEALVHIVEEYVDPKDYLCEVEVIEGAESDFSDPSEFERGLKKKSEEEDEDEEDDDEEEDYWDEDDIDEGDEDEVEEEESEDDYDDDKW